MTATAPLLPETRPSFYDRWTARVARRSAARPPVGLARADARHAARRHPAPLESRAPARVHRSTRRTTSRMRGRSGVSATRRPGRRARTRASSRATPTSFTSTGSFVVHPPLGKWLIGAGMALFGADSSFGWRITTALARHRDGARAVLRRQGDDAVDRVRDGRVAADGDRRARDRPEPRRAARHLPDLLRAARVLVRAARSPHAP